MTPELTRQLASAKADLDATQGATGSGTVACRLWNTLRALVAVVEKEKEV